MKLTPGQIIEFDYDFKDTAKKELKTPIKISLKQNVIDNIVNELSKYDEKPFLEMGEKIKPLVELIKQKDEMAELRGRKHKTQEEKDLEEKISLLKKELFPIKQQEISKEKQAKNLFYRNYDVNKIKEGKTNKAIFIGSWYTTAGNIINNFYTLNDITVEKEKIIGLEEFLWEHEL